MNLSTNHSYYHDLTDEQLSALVSEHLRKPAGDYINDVRLFEPLLKLFDDVSIDGSDGGTWFVELTVYDDERNEAFDVFTIDIGLHRSAIIAVLLWIATYPNEVERLIE